MCRNATSLTTALLLLLTTPLVSAQNWRKVGNTTLALGLASPAGGPVSRVWFSPDGSSLFAQFPSGQIWQTSDYEKWVRFENSAPPAPESFAGKTPEPGARISTFRSQKGRIYSAGKFAWRSDDGGASWSNVSGFQGKSILGGALSDVAVSPSNPDEIAVAGATGVWRSVDGGSSWAGLNENLPNFPVQRLLAVPEGGGSTRILTLNGVELVWNLGERQGWQPAGDSLLAREAALIASVPASGVTAAIRVGDVTYAGTADGRLLISDRGRPWRESPAVAGAGRIERIFADAKDGRFAVAITSSRQNARVLRTVNGGVFWDDITSDLPAGLVRGITADRLTGAVYVASDAGVFQTVTDPQAASPATPWTRLREEPARDVMLDASGNQLYAALEGLGIFAEMAPHRARDPRVVSAGDRVLRAAAPGSLLSVIGARIESARAGEKPAVVLAANDSESQVQLPWELVGSSIMVSLNSPNGRIQLGLPVTPASPSIFVDPDGHPVITNADSGLVLDASAPAHSNARIQILATGLGQVTPSWPIGLAAPLQDPPKVVATVRAWLDREPLEVSRATLAPGFAGLYLVEIQLPSIVNRGPAELYIEAAGGTSNRVQIWLEP